MRPLIIFSWIVCLLAATLGFVQLMNTVTSTGISAPQQAAGAAMGLLVCVVPYVFTRALEGIKAQTIAAGLESEANRAKDAQRLENERSATAI